MNTFKTTSSLGFKLKQLLVFCLCLLTSPLVIVSIILFVILRLIVKYTAKLIRKDLCILSPVSTFFGADDIHNSPNHNIVVTTIILGDLDSHKFKETIVYNLLESDNGRQMYPELKQYLMKWGGYLFWKNDKQFNINNHYKVVDNGKQDAEEHLSSIMEEGINRPWKPTKPLWRITLIKNYKFQPSNPSTNGPYTLMIWESNHLLADRYSILHLLFGSIGGNKIVTPSPHNRAPRPFQHQIVQNLTFPLRLMWETSEIFLQLIEQFYFNAPSEDFASEQLLTDVSPLIPLSTIKDVQKRHNVSFAAVQLAALTGSIRSYLLKRNLTVPQVYPCRTVVPKAGHKLHKLMNWMGFVSANLPTGKNDLLQILTLSQNEFLRYDKSAVSTASYTFMYIAGCFTNRLMRFVSNQHRFPIALTSFPSGTKEGYLLGNKAIECFAAVGPGPGNTGVIVALDSYASGFRISISARASVMKKEDLKELNALLAEHFETLRRLPAPQEINI